MSVVRFPIDTPAVAWYAPGDDAAHHGMGKIAEGLLGDVLGAALNFSPGDRDDVFIEVEGRTYPVANVKLGRGPVGGWQPKKDIGP